MSPTVNLDKNVVKNLLFEFIIKEYKNKVKYGHDPTPLEFFYNNWLIDRSVEMGLIQSTHAPARLKEEYKDKFLDVTWEAVEDLLRDRIIKRRLINSDDLSRWNLYVPTGKGLTIWEKYERLLIIPSNLVDTLRAEIPEINQDTDMVLNYLNEAVSCFFHNLQVGCCLCLSMAAEQALLSFSRTLCRYVVDERWSRAVETARSGLERAQLIKEKLSNVIKFGRLIKEYKLLFPKPDPNFKDDLESLIRGLDLISSVMALTRRKDNTPSLELLKVEETFREDLVLGYLLGSYPYFRHIFVIKEIIDNINDIQEK